MRLTCSVDGLPRVFFVFLHLDVQDLPRGEGGHELVRSCTRLQGIAEYHGGHNLFSTWVMANLPVVAQAIQ